VEGKNKNTTTTARVTTRQGSSFSSLGNEKAGMGFVYTYIFPHKQNKIKKY